MSLNEPIKGSRLTIYAKASLTVMYYIVQKPHIFRISLRYGELTIESYLNPGGRDSPDFGMGDLRWRVVGSPGNIISYSVQEYEMRTLFKVVTFQK